VSREGDRAGGKGRLSARRSALSTCTPKGRCKIGWIVSHGGRASWDVWLDLHIGEGRLRQQRD
jgi:hypothetical protein